MPAFSPEEPAVSAHQKPLVVRLRNWVGDVVLGLPTLERLAAAGYELRLVGRGWAASLLAGHGWPVEKLEKGAWRAARQFRRLRRELAAQIQREAGGQKRRFPRTPLDALCLPFSFSSALQLRLAGLRAVGYADEGRSFLLGKSIPKIAGIHELESYWRLGDALLGVEAPLPARIHLKVSPAHRAAAAALCAARQIRPGYLVICPFAGGTFEGHDKRWPEFPAFAQTLGALGRDVVLCPGPDEVAEARRDYPAAICLEKVDLGTYAALLANAALMISNDTGPGHMAAAVGIPTLSVLGPTNPAQWGAWGPTVKIAQRGRAWPTPAEVTHETRSVLAASSTGPALFNVDAPP